MCVSCVFGAVRDEKVEKVSKVEFYDLMATYAKVLANARMRVSQTDL